MMSTVYDAEGKPLTTQSAVDNNEFTTIDKPSNSFIHPLECDPDQSPISVRYVRTGNSDSTAVDDRFSDFGVFQVSTVGQPTVGSVIGEIWCTYDVELLKPQLTSPSIGTSWLCGYLSSAAYGDSSNPAWFLSADNVNKGSSLPVTFSPNSNTCTIPLGYDGNFILVVNRATTPFDGTNGYNFTGELGIASLGGAIKGITAWRSPTGLTPLAQTQGWPTNGANPTMSQTQDRSSGTLAYLFNIQGGTLTDRSITLSGNGIALTGTATRATALNVCISHIDSDIAAPTSALVAKFKKLGLPDEFITHFLLNVGGASDCAVAYDASGPSSSSSSASSSASATTSVAAEPWSEEDELGPAHIPPPRVTALHNYMRRYTGAGPQAA
jgi:hypothetical protein